MKNHRFRMPIAVLSSLLVSALAAAPAVAESSGARGTGALGEPSIPDEADRPLPEKYTETPGAHAERPGKHSTTAGRHGTSGEIGGGINTQSGSEAGGTEHPILDQCQDKAGENNE